MRGDWAPRLDGLARTWVQGPRTPARAEELLAPFRVQGTVVCSDAAGLSRSMHEGVAALALARVAATQQVVYENAIARGGVALAPWIADDTRVLYPGDVPLDVVLDGCLQTHAELPADGPGIGFCVGSGEHWLVDGALYGPEASAVAWRAEEQARAGDTLFSDALAPKAPRLVERPRTPRNPGRPTFPFTFSPSFADLVPALLSTLTRERAIHEATRWMREATVVFVAREPTGTDPIGILDGLACDGLLHALVRERADAHATPTACGIGLFDDNLAAFEAAVDLRDAATGLGLPLRIGLDRSDVLAFETAQMAGDAINLAAKLSEELGRTGVIQLTSRAMVGVHLPEARRFTVVISRVAIEGASVG